MAKKKKFLHNILVRWLIDFNVIIRGPILRKMMLELQIRCRGSL
jgi:hypothetical protein